MPLIKGSSIQSSQQQTPLTTKSDEDNTLLRALAQIPQGAVQGITSALDFPKAIAQEVRDALGIKHKGLLPNFTQAAEAGLKKILPEGYTEPKGFGEKLARNIGSSLPAAALAIGTGGASLPVSVATAGGAIGETIAEEAGAGPIARIAASLLGSAGATKGLHSLQSHYKIKPQNLLSIAETQQQKLYNQERVLGEKINGSAGNYRKNLESLETRISKSGALTSAQKAELKDKIQLALEDINESTNSINASQLVKRKQENNAIFKHLQGSKNKEAREYLKQIQKVIFEEGETIGKKNKKWFKSWKDADSITEVLKYGDRLEELAEEAPKLKQIVRHPLAKTVLIGSGLGGGLYKGAISGQAALVLGGTYFAGKAAINQAKYLSKFLEQPVTKKLLNDSLKYTLHRQTPQLLKTFELFNSQAEKFERNHPEVKEEIQPKVGLIKGKKI
jgi:hypothetical protein